MNYSQELKEAMLRRMLPPNNESITKISKEEGISEQTLRNWRDKARKEGYATVSNLPIFGHFCHPIFGHKSIKKAAEAAVL